MKLIVLGVLVLLLSGCNSVAITDLLDRMEFDENECGTFQMTGNIDIGSNPILTSEVHANLDKRKPCPPDEEQLP